MKEMPEPQRRIARDGPLPVQNLGNPIGRHLELSGELGSTHLERLKLLGEMLSRMNCRACHGPLLVIVHDLHVARALCTLRPLKADPPLIVNADAVLALPVSFQGLEPVPRQV